MNVGSLINTDTTPRSQCRTLLNDDGFRFARRSGKTGLTRDKLIAFRDWMMSEERRSPFDGIYHVASEEAIEAAIKAGCVERRSDGKTYYLPTGCEIIPSRRLPED